jgi:diadenosine tetraphosphate (Ap4A) HIT family hydrolase
MSIFLELSDNDKIYNGTNFFLIKDRFPVSPGHVLIISKDLKKDFFELNDEERNELPLMIEVAKKLIEKEYKPDGYNIGINCGETAGQTVFHFHCHVIPRYKGDMENPRGGVRHCIKGKGNY